MAEQLAAASAHVRQPELHSLARETVEARVSPTVQAAVEELSR